MSDANNIPPFSPEDILRYQQGLLSPKERNAMEKAALEDPFLADALEGYAVTGAGATDLQDLQSRLKTRVESGKVLHLGSGKSGFPWLRVAAAMIILAGAGIPAYVFLFKNNKNELSKNEVKQEAPVISSDKKATDTTIIQQQGNATVTFSDTLKPGSIPQSNRQVSFLKTESQEQDETKSFNAIAPPAPGRKDTLQIITADGYAQAKPLTMNSNSNPAPGGTVTFDYKSVAKDKQIADADGKKELDNIQGFSKMQPGNQQKKNANVAFKVDQNNKNQIANAYYFNNFRGRVMDNSNNPLPFANITNVEDNVGTYADARGYFNLTSPDSILHVQVRSVGFNNSNVQLRNSLLNNQITLREDTTVNAFVISNLKPNTDLHARKNNLKLTEPEPSDGWDNYDTYLANNLVMPNEYRSQKAKSGGEVEVSFEVDKNGEPTDIRIEKSLCSTCDKEAIRLIKEGPKWKRKTKNGRTTVKISF